MSYCGKSPPPADCLNLLRTVLGDQLSSLHTLQLHATIIISIDLEFNTQCCMEVGVSTLDPKELGWISDERSSTISRISSQHFRAPVINWCKKVGLPKPYRFGKTRIIDMPDLAPQLASILTPIDERGMPRDVILVGYSVASDILTVKKFLDIDIYDMASTKAIIDTTDVSRYVLNLEPAIPLRSLLTTLHLDHLGLHNAAHDSRYTLRALLMLFHWHYRQSHNVREMSWESCSDKRMSTIEQLARLHDPCASVLSCRDRKKMEGSEFDRAANADFVDEETYDHLLYLLDPPE